MTTGKQCAVRVYDAGGWHSHQCERKATIEFQGISYCSIHSPKGVQHREEQRQAKYRERECKVCGWYLESYWDYCPHCGTTTEA